MQHLHPASVCFVLVEIFMEQYILNVHGGCAGDEWFQGRRLSLHCSSWVLSAGLCLVHAYHDHVSKLICERVC